MKVLQVIDRLNIGGAERVMLNISQLLAGEGVEVGVLLFNAGFPLDKCIDNRAKIYVLNRSNKYSLQKLKKANSICSGYDIVHVHMRHCYTYVRLAQLLFGGKYKIILHDHYGDIEINKSIPTGWNTLFKPRYYIGVSNTLIDWAQHTLNVPANRTWLLANTVIPPINNVSIGNGNMNTILMVANIRQTKNIEFAVNLFKKLDYECTIYGNKTDEVYYSSIVQLIDGNPKIKIIQGISDVWREYNKYSMAVHCGVSETGPLVLLEYLAYGMPFIAYKTGEVAERIYKELPECFMDSFDTSGWVTRIHQIRQKNMGDKLKAVFRNHFSPEKYIKQCLEIYSDVSC